MWAEDVMAGKTHQKILDEIFRGRDDWVLRGQEGRKEGFGSKIDHCNVCCIMLNPGFQPEQLCSQVLAE